MENKTWTLAPTHTLILAPPSVRSECFKCQLDKEIWVITDTPREVRKFCWSCSLTNLYELETGDYPVENKEQIIKELRIALLSEGSNPELLDCYE